jgi:ABC-2 type transport system permease protein
MRAALTLVDRELTRFFRQKSRLMTALVQPMIFWGLFSAGFRNSFVTGDGTSNYTQFLLPGMAAMIVLFTAIFSTISVIRDRNEGFLQGVLVAPVPRSAIVLGTVLGGTILAVLQATLFLLLGFFVGVELSWDQLLGAVGVLGLMGIGLTGLGFMFAWPMDSVQGFHGVMSVIMFPMWLLSGAIFPVDQLDGWFRWVVMLNPLSYGVAALRHVMGMQSQAISLPLGLAVAAGFAIFTLAMSTRAAGKAAKGDLR